MSFLVDRGGRGPPPDRDWQLCHGVAIPGHRGNGSPESVAGVLRQGERRGGHRQPSASCAAQLWKQGLSIPLFLFVSLPTTCNVFNCLSFSVPVSRYLGNKYTLILACFFLSLLSSPFLSLIIIYCNTRRIVHWKSHDCPLLTEV